jgi:hypothetical protein
MDGVLEAPPKTSLKKREGKTRSKADEFRFLLPGSLGWELWQSGESGLSLVEAAFDFSKNQQRWASSSFLAVPVQHTLVFPLWLATTDLGLMGDMVWMVLERKGLLQGSREQTVMSYRVIHQEAGKSLLSVRVLSDPLPAEWCLSGVFNYPSGLDLYTWPSNHLVVWKELGRQAFAFTMGREVVYAQTCVSDTPDEAMARDVLTAFYSLQSEQALSVCEGLTAWGDYQRKDLETLARALGVPILVHSLPPAAKGPWKEQLIPASSRLAQQQKKQGERQRRWLMLFAGLYLVVLLSVASYFAWLLWTRHQLVTDLKKHETEVQTIRNTAFRWEALEWALLPQSYPVEVLYRSTRQLPEEGVRLVTYDQRGTRVFMTGEAKNSAAAFQFLQGLKNSPDLSSYQWDMPSPKLLPNDSAQFQIEGKTSHASPDSE